MENFIFWAVWHSCSEMLKKMDVPKSMKMCVVETTLIQIYSFQPGTLNVTEDRLDHIYFSANFSKLLATPTRPVWEL